MANDSRSMIDSQEQVARRMGCLVLDTNGVDAETVSA